jgi:hypothetical protein
VSYVDLNTIHNPTTGTAIPASWGDQVRDNLEFLIDPPACSVYHTTGQTVPTVTATTLLADAEYFDNASWHSTVSNTGRLTAGTAQRALIFCTVNFDADADGSRRLDLRVNGTTTYELFNIASGSGVSDVVVTGATALTMAANDYVEIRATHTAGNDLTVTLVEFGATFLTRA